MATLYALYLLPHSGTALLCVVAGVVVAKVVSLALDVI